MFTTLASLVMLALLPVVPAAAATTPLEYSRDGVNWSATVPTALFGSEFRIAPGGGESTNMWVRSMRAAPTALTVLVLGAVANDPEYASALTIAGDDGSSGLAATAFSRLGTCARLIPTRTLTQGQAVKFSVTVALDAAVTGRQTQASTATFDIALNLTEPGPPASGDSCASTPTVIPGTPQSAAGANQSAAASVGPLGLAYTGSTVPYALLVLVGIALGVGWLMTMTGRRIPRDQQ